MERNSPLVKTFAAALALALAAGPAPVYAQHIAGRAAVPGVAVVPGAAGAVPLSGVSARANLAPTLSAPGSVLPAPSLNTLSIVPAAQPLVAVQAAAAQPVSAAPAAGAIATPVAAAIPSGALQADQAALIKEEPKAGPLARVFSAVRNSLRLGRTDALFTGANFRPESAPAQHEGVRLDPAPAQPRQTESPGVSWDKVQLPGRPSRPTLSQRLFGRASVAPVALPGDPRDAAGVEAALRRMIQDRPAEFGGIAPAQLATVMAHKVAGAAGLTDTVYVNFKQLHNGVEVEGTFLGFTVKLINGQAVVIGSSANIFPWLAVDTFGRLDERAVLERAAVRLGHPTASAEDFLDQGVRVIHLGGQWRAARLMVSKSKTLMAAVDINSGETFAWDPRHRVSVAGKAEGRGIADGPIEAGVPTPLALGHVEIVASNGRKYYADAEGRFTVEGEGDAPVQLTVRLSGRYAKVQDQARKDLVVTVEAKPGEELRVVFNPEGKDENAVAQVNAYVHTTLIHEYLAKNGIDIAALNKPMPVKTNIDDECNAYYTPWSPSLNFFKSSSRCANSSYNDVIYHEYGHGIDDAAHRGIPNGGLSEAIGDMFAMLLTKQPVIGRGFIKGRTPDYIRHGENDYQYRSRDEVHAQGQAGMGFVWKLRKSLVAALGEIEGQRLAEALVLPAIIAMNRDIPAFINSVLLRDVNEEGVAPHFEHIRAAAAAHGIKVNAPKPGVAAPNGGYVEYENWWSGLGSAWSAAARLMVHR